MKILASSVAERFGTRDPLLIAAKNEIMIVKEPLGNIQGYYNNAHGQKFIHLNEELPEYFLLYVTAHLLYQVFTNPKEMMFLKRKTGTKFTENEAEANIFALYLCFQKDTITVHDLFNVFHLTKEEITDFLQRLRRIWDSEHKLTDEELLNHVLSCTR